MSLIVKREERILKYWMKIISKNDTMKYRVYNLKLEMLKTDNTNPVISWVEQVKISYVNLALHTFGILRV